MKSATRSHQSWLIAVAMSTIVLPSCLRDAPGNACTQHGDCYVGEQCLVGVCTPQGSPLDIPGDLSDTPDAPTDFDQNQPQDAPPDLTDVDAPSDMPDLVDMPDLPPVDLLVELMPEGQVTTGARLPGPRASFINQDMITPLVLAYFQDEQNGTLKLYRFDDTQGWISNVVATELNWPISDLSENAALFGDGLTRVLYEAHTPGMGITLRSALVNTSTGSVYGDEQVSPLHAVTTLDFDFGETSAGPSALIVLPDRIERLARQANGSWEIAATYSNTFTSAKFVVDTQHVCGVTTASELLCYAEPDTTTPVITETMVTGFETRWLPNIDPTRHREFVMASRGDTFIHEEIANVQNGNPQNKGLQWVKNPVQSALPPGDRLSIADSPQLVSYRQRNGSVVYSINALNPNALFAPITYINKVTASCSKENTLHIFGSSEPGDATQSLFYEVHAPIP